MLAFLKSAVPRLHEISVKHGTTLRVKIGEPAADSQLRELEALVGEPLLESLRSFLRETNGFGIYFHDRADSAPFPLELYKIDLHGTDTIQSETRDMRSYIDMDPYDEFARALRCFDVANIHGGLSRVVFSLDAVRPPNEYAFSMPT